VRLDPFRIQVLTVSLDSQVVLTLVGLVVASVVFRQSARQQGLDLRAGDWWDLIFASVVGARLAWIVTHAEYYLRQPLQAVVVLDGGLHTIGLALGAAYWVWRHSQTQSPPRQRVVDLVAIGVLTTFLFERAGCALTTCGTGPASELPWAILRGDQWYAPMALEQVVVLAVALIASVETLRIRGAAFAIALGALFLAETIAFLSGRPSVVDVVALTVLWVMYAMVSRLSMPGFGRGHAPDSVGRS
jgi:prolipoprotein diacylglyceryltransferase